MRTWAVVFAAVSCIVFTAVPANADEQDPVDLARDLAKQGFALAGEGDLVQAVTLLKRAAVLDPEPEYFCSAGNLYEQLGKPAQAHLWLSQCLAGGRMAARKPKAAKAYRKMLEKLEQTLRASHAPVEVSSTPSGASVQVSAFEDDDQFTTPALVWLPVGNHTARLQADGHVDQTVEIEITGTESKRLEVALELVATKPAVTEPAPNLTVQPETTASPDPIGNPDDPTEPRDTPRASRGKTPLILIGVGAAAVITGGVFHILASGTRSELAELPDGSERDDKQSTFNLQRGLAIGGYAVGAVVGGIGLYMLAHTPKKAKSVAVGPAPAGDGAMVWLSWSR